MQAVFDNSAALKNYLDTAVPRRAGNFVDVLIEEGFISGAEFEALSSEKRLRNVSYGVMGDALKEEGILSDVDFAKVLAKALGMPYVVLRDFDVSPDIIKTVPIDIARQYLCMPLFIWEKMLVVAMADPSSQETNDMVTFFTGKVLHPVVAARDDIERAISHFYGGSEEQDVIESLSQVTTGVDEKAQQEGIKLAQEKPTVRMVHHFIIDAINNRASDIHVRPREDRVDLLFRIDGSLVRMRSFAKQLLPAIVSRIKIFGNMDIAEHRLPQDGQARINHRGNVIDMRISTIPAVNGESVVIRILDKSASLKTLDQVGFTEEDKKKFASLLTQSHGMILVTGPTGCGKSTTLYAALQEIKKSGDNVITVEDPVEYHIDGIMQIQVQPKIDYTFARALRHILRHDPDDIMVGEIRDLETAKMAVESSLTGHIVLSTLHTNSAATTVTRLVEMGIDPYLVNTSLLAVLAQRLVRRICPHCMTEEDGITEVMREALGVAPDEVFYKGKGCELCHGTGYHGRMAVYELLMVTPGLRAMIRPHASADDIEQQAVRDGMVPLTQMALQAAREKKTSLQEVYLARLL